MRDEQRQRKRKNLTCANGVPNGIGMSRDPGRAASAVSTAPMSMAERVSANILESRAARQASNFEVYAARESGLTVHKNSLSYIGDTHIYGIQSPRGTFKIGESAQGVNAAGQSIRGEAQARALTKATGMPHRSKILDWHKGKSPARLHETRLIERFRRVFGNDALPGNKTNR